VVVFGEKGHQKRHKGLLAPRLAAGAGPMAASSGPFESSHSACAFDYLTSKVHYTITNRVAILVTMIILHAASPDDESIELAPKERSLPDNACGVAHDMFLLGPFDSRIPDIYLVWLFIHTRLEGLNPSTPPQRHGDEFP